MKQQQLLYFSLCALALQVYLYVPRATVDLSIFGSDQASLIGSLQSAHRSIRFQSMPQQRRAIVEGPFSAVQALREDLILRASRFKPSALHATAQQGQTSNHHGPVSSHSPKTNQGLASSHSKSVSQQSTGEVQSSFSKAKSPNNLRQKVSDEGLDGASSFDRYHFQGPTKYRTERPKTSLREVEGEETKPMFASSFSSLDPLPPEETSAKQQREESFSEKPSRADGISAGNDLISHYSSMNSSSSLVNTKLPQSGRRPVSPFIKSDVLVPSQDSGDIWVDLYIFKYIEQFCKEALDRCLTGMDMVIKCINKETGLMCISLTQKQPSKAASVTLSITRNYLKVLMEVWQVHLRVQEIFYNRAGWLNTQKLIQICDEGKMLYRDVLYILEDSCIKVIGPSESSYLFSRRVEDEITKHKRISREFLRK